MWRHTRSRGKLVLADPMRSDAIRSDTDYAVSKAEAEAPKEAREPEEARAKGEGPRTGARVEAGQFYLGFACHSISTRCGRCAPLLT